MPTTALTLRQLAEREDRVFPTYPQVTRYFPAGSIEDGRARLGRAIERGDGPGLIVGGPGTGKSLLLQVLAAQYHEQFDVVLPACARLCTRRALLQSILFELGMPYRSRDEGELRLSLLDHLLSRDECPAGLLLLVDEAQTLTAALLDELRVLTNVVRGGQPRVRLVLAGSSALEECFADPQLESFSQRLSGRCYLSPFSREETTQFIRAQLAASRANADELFSADAWLAIFEATDGVPRLINQLCDQALTIAVTADHALIDRQIIQSAWAKIQQLPTPWETPVEPVLSEASRVIEFGNLTDEMPRPSTLELMKIDAVLDVEFAAASERELDTELDLDDELIIPQAVIPPVREIAMQKPQSKDESGNPFAEKFDEEEVVLDTFAAWDDMFRNAGPKVANRRDPEFATMVATAMNAAPAASVQMAARAADLSFEFDLQNILHTAVEIAAESAELTQEKASKRPHLRIADIADVQASAADAAPLDDEPVLIIEDDAPSPAPHKPAVRREEYRHLFSRLRGG
jgi:type II secretory pathway predicted ATPase ExeA